MLRGSVTLAAQELEISQPAVSRLLRDFEERIGFPLFERRGNQLAPTPEADLLLAEVERSFSGLRDIARYARDLGERRAGALRIVAMPALAMGFIPRFMGEFLADRELEHIYLHGMPSHLVVEAVASGQAEVGFAAAPLGRPGLLSERIAAKAVLAVPAEHRLAKHRVVSPADLVNERFISISDGGASIFGSQIDIALAGVPRKIVATTPLTGIACSLVAAGVGVAMVDPFAASEFEDRGVAFRPFRPVIEAHIVSVTSANRKLSRIAEEFLEALRTRIDAMSHPDIGNGRSSFGSGKPARTRLRAARRPAPTSRQGKTGIGKSRGT